MFFSFEWYSIFVSLAAILVSIAALYYWYVTRPYAKFPTYPFLWYLVYCKIFRKFPSNMSFSSICFQKMIEVGKQQRKGVAFIWWGQPFVFIYGEEEMKVVLKDQRETDKPQVYDVINDLFGAGLITSNGETWRKHRKMLNPAFHMDMLKGKMETFNACAEFLVKELTEEMHRPSFDIAIYLKRCAFNVLYESIFGLKVSEKENESALQDFMYKVTIAYEFMMFRIVRPWLHFRVILKLTSSGRQYLSWIDDCHAFTKKVISEMKKSINSRQASDTDAENHQNRKSFTHILLELQMKDPSFTFENLQDEIMTFILAGYDTIATALTWTLYLLGLHPDVQELAYNEVMSVTDAFVTFEHLCDLKYLECVILESMRIYSPVPLVGRKLKNDAQCGKYKIPKGTTVILFPHMLHKDPQIHHEPEKFDPDRFVRENPEKRPYSYMPFAKGPRQCIGKKYAMLEMKVILAHILRNFKIMSFDKREDVKMKWKLVLVPMKRLHIELTPR